MASARDSAARVLMRVLDDGAYASAALSAELERTGLPARERALATELVYGTLRALGALEARLLEHAPRGIKDTRVRAELLIAAYQLLLLERVPAFAAVDAAVESLRGARGARVAGFANAVLRRLAQGQRLDPVAAARRNAPAWLLAELDRTLGEAETEALLAAPTEPFVTLRTRSGRALGPWLEALERGRLSARARYLRGAGDPRSRPEYAAGEFVVQEEGAQLVGLALGARPGERVLDACAGRGQKSSLLAEQIGESGSLWACDLHAHKLDALRGEFARLGLRAPETRALDLSQPADSLPNDFDRVLVDAPCSGTGTLRRRPEIGLRLTPGDPERLSLLAERLLRQASARLKPGGRALFAVCSVLPAEGEALVARVGDVLEPTPFDAPELAGLAAPSDSTLRLTPGRHGTDGYFIASFVRRG